jgi:hypothetical protein
MSIPFMGWKRVFCSVIRAARTLPVASLAMRAKLGSGAFAGASVDHTSAIMAVDQNEVLAVTIFA